MSVMRWRIEQWPGLSSVLLPRKRRITSLPCRSGCLRLRALVPLGGRSIAPRLRLLASCPPSARSCSWQDSRASWSASAQPMTTSNRCASVGAFGSRTSRCTRATDPVESASSFFMRLSTGRARGEPLAFSSTPPKHAPPLTGSTSASSQAGARSPSAGSYSVACRDHSPFGGRWWDEDRERGKLAGLIYRSFQASS